jgi:hypothetical protein
VPTARALGNSRPAAGPEPTAPTTSSIALGRDHIWVGRRLSEQLLSCSSPEQRGASLQQFRPERQCGASTRGEVGIRRLLRQCRAGTGFCRRTGRICSCMWAGTRAPMEALVSSGQWTMPPSQTWFTGTPAWPRRPRPRRTTSAPPLMTGAPAPDRSATHRGRCGRTACRSSPCRTPRR